MKYFLVLFSFLFATSASSEGVQAYCDTMAQNAQKMYNDVTSNQFRSGEVSYSQLENNYARQTSTFASDLNLRILKKIYDNKDQLSAQYVNDWIYKRCASDYEDYQRWWRSNSRGRASDYLAPSLY